MSIKFLVFLGGILDQVTLSIVAVYAHAGQKQEHKYCNASLWSVVEDILMTQVLPLWLCGR